jgi:type II secretory pathway pseudopilin PulG
MFFSRYLSPRAGRSRSGFTIIELIVSIGITAVLVTLMVTISVNMLNGWNRANGQLTTGNQARIVLDQLSQDLQSALMRRDGRVWLAATVQRNATASGDDADVAGFFDTDWSSPGVVKPSSSGAPDEDNSLDLAGDLPLDDTDKGKIENLRFGQTGVWLRFFTTPPAANASLATLGAPRAVSYQISRGKLGGGSNADAQFIYALFRTEIAPDNTFRDGFNITDNAYDTVAGASGQVRRPTINDVIASNVVDFGVRLFERNAAGALVEVFPARRGADGVLLAGQPATTVPLTYLATSSGTAYTGYGNGAGTNLPVGFPVAAEIMVRILTPEGVRQIQAFENDLIERPADIANDDEYWWQIVIQNSQVYTRRVELRGAVL